MVSRVFKQHAGVVDLVPTPTAHLQQRLTNLLLDREASKERTREQTRKLFQSIHALSKKGIKSARIARTLRIHRHTVEKFLAFKAPPQRRHFTKKLSALAPYEEDYILGRWEQGCRNATRIWKEIAEQGYPGAYQNVVRITRYLKEQERLAEPLPDRPSTGYLRQPCRRDSREEIREPLRRRDPRTPEVEDGPPDYGAMLHLVRGVRREAKRQGAEEQRAGPLTPGGMDRERAKHPALPS